MMKKYSRDDLFLQFFYKRSDCICDVLRDLVPFAQFKKCEKHPWRGVTFSKVAGCNFTKSKTLPWVLFAYFELYK